MPCLSYGQLVTTTGIAPTTLVEDILVGDGVAVSGVRYTGFPEAIGSFNGVATNLGLASGIILTTGTVKNEIGGLIREQRGPFGPNNTSSAGKANGAPGYGPLTTLAGVETENAAILEFDFVPQSDSVRFRYVFGSDEYPEFVGEGFNDVFAFYISGPGFGGTVNMAQIPLIGGPVSIDNINNGVSNEGPCRNCDYYVNNGLGNTAPQDASDFYIQYDGFTIVMEARAAVQCGETYHLSIAIADAGDEAYDSGIFLEANSLESYLPLKMSAALELDGYGDGKTMGEGCEKATVTVTRRDVSEVLSIPIVTYGDATEGVDYENLPETINFAIGEGSKTFSFDVYDDDLIEGIESLTIELNHPDPCGEDNFVTIDLDISDVDDLVATVEDQMVRCAGDEVELEVIVTGGLPDYTYEWAIGGDAPTVTIETEETAEFFVTVNDACIGIPVTVSGTVTVPVYPPLVVFTSDDTTVLCPNTPMVLAAEAGGGEGTYSYAWTLDELLLTERPFVTVSPMVTKTFIVTVTDGCGETIEGDVMVTVTASVLQLEMGPDQLSCPGDSTNLFVTASEGLGDYTYYWLHSGETTSNVKVAPWETTDYYVAVEDACHTYEIVGKSTVEVIKPLANFNIISQDPMDGLPVSFFNTSERSVAWEWDFDNGLFSNLHSPSTVYSPYGWYDVTLIAYDYLGCPDTITKPIYIKPEYYFYAPNAFTPDGDSFNNSYSVSTIGAVEFYFGIFNRWGEIVFESYNPSFQWNGDYGNMLVQDAVLVYKAIIKNFEGEVNEYEGTITILR